MVIDILTDFNWRVIVANLTLMVVAYVLALPIALNRERYSRSAGLRTFPMVAVASCGFVLIGIDVFDDIDTNARVLQGIITGMGFIGGGAILKSDQSVVGTATAASMWTTGAIGVAVGFGRLEIALLLSVITYLTLKFVPSVKEMVPKQLGEDQQHGLNEQRREAD